LTFSDELLDNFFFENTFYPLFKDYEFEIILLL